MGKNKHSRSLKKSKSKKNLHQGEVERIPIPSYCGSNAKVEVESYLKHPKIKIKLQQKQLRQVPACYETATDVLAANSGIVGSCSSIEVVDSTNPFSNNNGFEFANDCVSDSLCGTKAEKHKKEINKENMMENPQTPGYNQRKFDICHDLLESLSQEFTCLKNAFNEIIKNEQMKLLKNEEELEQLNKYSAELKTEETVLKRGTWCIRCERPAIYLNVRGKRFCSEECEGLYDSPNNYMPDSQPLYKKFV
ncbi:uncharacterized protein LOC106082026 [Stomoxys calcitrans]|uniref:Uncharacterized protein n=1 Tax=Stomoxys calcitrans TaxID=35570 RepID=A0A1I8PMM9_STOCA|nr:uncharacterized protein LOC106082026 [Stomoxys calcitrans]